MPRITGISTADRNTRAALAAVFHKSWVGDFTGVPRPRPDHGARPDGPMAGWSRDATAEKGQSLGVQCKAIGPIGVAAHQDVWLSSTGHGELTITPCIEGPTPAGSGSQES